MLSHERVPHCFSWGTSQSADQNAGTVEYSSSRDDDSGTIPHERIQDLLGRKYAKVLQQDSRLGQKKCGGVEDLGHVTPLAMLISLKHEKMINES